jgi:hypothetical protein
MAAGEGDAFGQPERRRPEGLRRRLQVVALCEVAPREDHPPAAHDAARSAAGTVAQTSPAAAAACTTGRPNLIASLRYPGPAPSPVPRPIPAA